MANSETGTTLLAEPTIDVHPLMTAYRADLAAELFSVPSIPTSDSEPAPSAPTADNDLLGLTASLTNAQKQTLLQLLSKSAAS